ncbi:probable pectate lyase P56 [Sesamum indicum]|uniref:Pectate lyase n=1 Tax=Sesamum indicum TaxID=4182 RepID=A0A6I9UC48_SESIN|nr:probable pectate lyase P56 [Sesamum indicum]
MPSPNIHATASIPGLKIMEKNFSITFLFLFFISAAFIPTSGANYTDSHDVYWQERAALARARILQAYNPNPEAIVTDFNQKTKEALEHSQVNRAPHNGTRRNLGRKYMGPCVATNPIDRCWRCNPNWALNRQKLADCAQGFGAAATGGKFGPIYVVRDPSDNDMMNPKPGTLRHAVIQPGPLWIIFSHSMNIKLNQELIMTSDKTIDGRGALIQITGGAGLTIQFVHNIIITNLKITNIVPSPGGTIRDSVNHFGFRTGSDGDAINIFGSHNIWIDHLSMSGGADGLIDAVMGSTAITISNCHFVRHDKVLLFGGRDMDEIDSKMQITLAFNHFGKHLVQRMPRCRRGFFHLVNNDYTHWLMYAIGGSHHATIISQGNRYIAPPLPDKRQVTHREADSPESEWRKWTWVTDHDVFLNGAYFVPSGDPNGAATYLALEKIRPAPGEQVYDLTRFAGALKCVVSLPC